MPLNGLSARGVIVHAQRDAIVIPEIELRKIAVQVLLGTVLIGAASCHA